MKADLFLIHHSPFRAHHFTDGVLIMSAQTDFRFGGVVDHVAVRCEDLARDVREYERMGFRVETMYEDWAMLRDARGFGVALLPPGSKHPPHLGMRVESRAELDEAAR